MSVAMRSEATISGSGSASGGKEGFLVAAVSEAGELYVWRCAPVGDDGRRIEAALLARISVGATRSAESEWHVSADQCRWSRVTALALCSSPHRCAVS